MVLGGRFLLMGYRLCGHIAVEKINLCLVGFVGGFGKHPFPLVLNELVACLFSISLTRQIKIL